MLQKAVLLFRGAVSSLTHEIRPALRATKVDRFLLLTYFAALLSLLVADVFVAFFLLALACYNCEEGSSGVSSVAVLRLKLFLMLWNKRNSTPRRQVCVLTGKLVCRVTAVPFPTCA